MYRESKPPHRTQGRLILSLLLSLVCGISCHQVQPQILKETGTTTLDAEKSTVPSPKNIVHRKRADVLRNILLKALDLPEKRAVCTELGKKKLQCADVVHRVSLGRMEPYTNSQYHHPDGVSLTSPMSLDRLVLSACAQRAGLDARTIQDNVISAREAVIFKGVKLTGDGRLVLSAAIDQAIIRLYQRGLTRDPTPFEIATIKELYEQIFQENRTGAAVNWMTLSCFVVFSSVEGAFY